MASIKQLAACIGLTGDVSVLRDFFGFFMGRLPPDPTGAPVMVSLKRQVERLQGKHFHLNVIAVGSNNFGNGDREQIDYSIYKIRNIYDQVGVGVGRVEHHGVLWADAGGLDAPTTLGELDDIWDNWTIDNDGIDVFVPLFMNVRRHLPSGSFLVTLGYSVVDGPCEGAKDTTDMSGCVVGLWDGRYSYDSDQTARTFGHEVGHYLSLDHPTDPDPGNLMTQSGDVDSPYTIRTAVELTSSQGTDIETHCLMKPGC